MKLELNEEEFAKAVEASRQKIKRPWQLARQNLPSRETFAWWSLERDLYMGLVVSCKEDLEGLLEEADFYLAQDPENWPHYILARFLE